MENYDFNRETHYTASAFIIQNQRVLLLKQKKWPLYWVMPGGHVNDDELPHEAIIREVLEETGLKIELLEKKDDVESPIATLLPLPHHLLLVPCRDKRDVSFIYTARVIGGKLELNQESQDGHWFSRNELETDARVGPATRFYGIKILQERSEL